MSPIANMFPGLDEKLDAIIEASIRLSRFFPAGSKGELHCGAIGLHTQRLAKAINTTLPENTERIVLADKLPVAGAKEPFDLEKYETEAAHLHKLMEQLQEYTHRIHAIGKTREFLAPLHVVNKLEDLVDSGQFDEISPKTGDIESKPVFLRKKWENEVKEIIVGSHEFRNIMFMPQRILLLSYIDQVMSTGRGMHNTIDKNMLDEFRRLANNGGIKMDEAHHEPNGTVNIRIQLTKTGIDKAIDMIRGLNGGKKLFLPHDREELMSGLEAHYAERRAAWHRDI